MDQLWEEIQMKQVSIGADLRNMKNLLQLVMIVSVTLFLSESSFSQKSDISEELLIEGKVISVTIEEDNRGVDFNFEIELIFSNKSAKPLILPKEASSLKVWEVYISGSKANMSENKFLYERSIAESVLGEDEDFTKAMWKVEPPTDMVSILKPKQSISYSIVTGAYFEKVQKYSANETWDIVKRISTLWLKLGINIYFDSDIYRKLSDEEITFGERLRKQWASYGILQFGRFYTESIQIDLKSAIIKSSLGLFAQPPKRTDKDFKL
jgi:hypothetical protein